MLVAVHNLVRGYADRWRWCRQNQIGFPQYVLTRRDEEVLSLFAPFWNIQRLELPLLSHMDGHMFQPVLLHIAQYAPFLRHLEVANPRSVRSLAGERMLGPWLA